MKEIRVKPIFGAHQIYQEIVNFPPQGVKYLGVSNKIKKGEYYQKKKIKERIGRILQILRIPRMVVVRPGNYDLIHSSRGIIPLTNKPWIIDVEHVHSFFGLNPKIIKKKSLKKLIERVLSSKNCKKILCHCQATRNAFFKYLNCKKFKEKIEVLYPASHIIHVKKEKHNKVRILSVLSDFNCKSGPQILEAFSRLEKKYKNIELYIRADVPDKFKKKYNSKNIKYTPYHETIIPREQLIKEAYSRADIFLYPTLTDSFGYSFIDALVAGLPIVTTNLFAAPEIVENEKNGFIVDIPGYNLKKEYMQTFPFEELTGKRKETFIKKIVLKLEKLIKDKKLRENMGKESLKKVKDGEFSIKCRNKKLIKIYKEALV